jgi:putative Holliday junction resolvase
MDGSEGPASAAMRRLALELGRATGLEVHLVDERLSSHAAEQGLRDRGLSHRDKRRRRDALAAAVILKDFLDRA